MKRKATERVVLTEFDEASTMAYLHGDVVDGEHEACCDYEYAREGRALREAARLQGQGLSFAEIGEEIDSAFSAGDLFIQHPWLEIFCCPGFPETPWNQLPQEARSEVLAAFSLPYDRAQLRTLDPAFVTKRLEAGLPLSRVEHILPVVFTIDFSKAKRKLCGEFAGWLERPENKALLAKHRRKHTGRTGWHADRLKDLAVWRLFEYCGNWIEANAFADAHRKLFEKSDAIFVVSCGKRRKVSFKEGDPRPFHDSRQGTEPVNETSLCSEESGFLRARARAQACLEELLPWETFKKTEKEELRAMSERIARAFGS
jgi:hypothetical protein